MIKLALCVIFNLPKNDLDHEIEIKFNGKNLYKTNSAKYLKLHTDKNLTWKHHIINLTIKSNKANVSLSNIRHCEGLKILISVYHVIFESPLSHISLVCVKNSSSVKRLHILQKRSLRLMFFLNRNAQTGPFYKNLKISKPRNKVVLTLPKIICDWFMLFLESHMYNT